MIPKEVIHQLNAVRAEMGLPPATPTSRLEVLQALSECVDTVGDLQANAPRADISGAALAEVKELLRVGKKAERIDVMALVGSRGSGDHEAAVAIMTRDPNGRDNLHVFANAEEAEALAKKIMAAADDVRNYKQILKGAAGAKS